MNTLIRQGKIIHYGGGDIELEKYYKTTEGQIYIAQTEHLIRAWRYAIALAARTLKNWADPDDDKIGDDILLSIKKALKDFSEKGYYKALFGDFYSAIPEKEVLECALNNTANLRHAVFHFKKLKIFKDNLQNASHFQFSMDLINKDENDKNEQLIEILKSIKLHKFFYTGDCKQIIAELQSGDTPTVPLPNFKKLVIRDANTVQKFFSEKPRKEDLKNPALLCKYSTLKMFYDGSFNTWLNKPDGYSLAEFIQTAKARTDKAAKDINNKKKKTDEIITSKISKMLDKIEDIKDINSFCYKLTELTAGAMAVQNGYKSNPKNAREQAEAVEEFKQDVIILAFDKYLADKKLDFIKDVKKTQMENINDSILTAKESQRTYESWQANLYLIMHLIPVNEVNNLYHQMVKWHILTGKSKRDNEEALLDEDEMKKVMKLYIDMHDAKFKGTEAKDTEDYSRFFVNKNDFQKIFYPNEDINSKVHDNLPRGLREMLRFADTIALDKIFEQHKIKHEDVARWQELNKEIGKEHEALQELHGELSIIKVKDAYELEDVKKYCEHLQKIIKYRELDNHVHFVNHLRLYRVMMAVLARLLDFAGMWERDLYFVTLALIKEMGKTKERFFDEKALDYLENGQIVEALKGKVSDIEGLNDIFSVDKKYQGSIDASGRNDFAHFNMLQKKQLNNGALNLINEINKARTLMSYDRKLKNAVTKSIIDLMDREGFILEGTMQGHDFKISSLKTKQINHLKKSKYNICENLNSEFFTKMLVSLVGSCYKKMDSITDVKLDEANWQNILKKN